MKVGVTITRRGVAAARRLGAMFLPKLPPGDFVAPTDEHLVQLGFAAATVCGPPWLVAEADQFVSLCGQDEGATLAFALARSYVRENAPTYFVSPADVGDCQSPRALRYMTGADIRRKSRICLFVLPQAWLYCGLYEAGERVCDLPGLAVPQRRLIVARYGRGESGVSYLHGPLDDRPVLEWAREAGLKAASFALVFNLLLLRQVHPQFFDLLGVRHGFRGRGAPSRPAQVFWYGRRTANLRHVVVRDARATTTTDPPAEPARHNIRFRDGHWRRQPHGARWELLHPDADATSLGYFPDGRVYHLAWIAFWEAPELATSPDEPAGGDVRGTPPTAGGGGEPGPLKPTSGLKP